MSVFHKNVIAGAAGQGGAAYQIDRSVRFNPADTPDLSRTPSSAGNTMKYTVSFWVKRTGLGIQMVLQTGLTYSVLTRAYFDSNSNFVFNHYNGSSYVMSMITQAQFRDLGAWYHFVISLDTTASTASDRFKLYVNGSEVTAWTTSTYPSQNQTTGWNANITQRIGRENTQTYGNYYNLNGYLAEFINVDGQALAASDFGEFDDNNVWQPKEYGGTFGTNGFHLDFSSNSSNAALGTDSSGNSNTFTVYNLSVASGAGNDSLIDTPSDYVASSGNNGGNYATLNALMKGAQVTLANGNLDWSASSSTPDWATRHAYSTIGVTSGKWYAESYISAIGSNQSYVGVVGDPSPPYNNTSLGYQAHGWGYLSSGNIYWQGGNNQSAASYTTGDTIGVALDLDNLTVKFYKNGTLVGTRTGLTSGKTYFFGANSYSNATQSWNFGQRPFSYTPPTGHKSLCTQNLPDPTIADSSSTFDTTVYTGNGSTKTVSGFDFSPDLVWIKNRANAFGHALYDTVRGSGSSKALRVDGTDAEGATTIANYTNLTSFNSDGFSLGTTTATNITNHNNSSHVAWAWDVGSSTATNTNGSVNSQVRANASAGISIVKATIGNSSVGHGLNAKPSLVITKTLGSGIWWTQGHIYSNPAANYQRLNSNISVGTDTSAFANTAATTTTFNFNATYLYGSSQDCISYCFAPVDGFSAFGQYTGNGSADGPFIYTGFRPAWVMIKGNNTSDWLIVDSTRDSINVVSPYLAANQSYAESGGGSFDWMDFLSNGFKQRNTGSWHNSSNTTYIYAAFAERPFKYARAR